MADSVGQLRAIQRIEVEFVDAMLAQMLYLFDRHARGNEAARLWVVVQPVEPLMQPRRHRCTATLGKAQ